MKRCWKYDPRERPTFAQIVGILLRHAEDGMLNFPDDEFRKVLVCSFFLFHILICHAMYVFLRKYVCNSFSFCKIFALFIFMNV